MIIVLSIPVAFRLEQVAAAIFLLLVTLILWAILQAKHCAAASSVNERGNCGNVSLACDQSHSLRDLQGQISPTTNLCGIKLLKMVVAPSIFILSS